jgi:hypothetical protein
VDRLRSWGRRVVESPWLLVGIVAGFLLICAWIAWAVHVSAEHSIRQGLGALLAWAAIAAVVALISIPFIWAFRVIRASAGSEQDEAEPEPGEAEATETG